MLIEVKLNERLRNYLEMKKYEAVSALDILLLLLYKHKDEPSLLDSELWQKYYGQYQHALVDQRMTELEYVKHIFPEEVRQSKRYSWKEDCENESILLEVFD